MKKAVKTVIGLLYDDPWLVSGIVVALLVIRVATILGLTGEVVGVALMVLLFVAIFVSVAQEVKRKRQGY